MRFLWRYIEHGPTDYFIDRISFLKLHPVRITNLFDNDTLMENVELKKSAIKGNKPSNVIFEKHDFNKSCSNTYSARYAGYAGI